MGASEIRKAFENTERVDPPDMGQDGPPEDGAPPPDMPGSDAPEAECAALPLNDYGNGQRLVRYFGEDILFVPRLGWFRWDGTRWEGDEDELAVRRDAQSVAGRILAEIPFVALEDWQREALELWRASRDEFLELEKIKSADRSDEQRARFTALKDIQAAGIAAESALTNARKAHRSHAKASGNTSKISAMMVEAKVETARHIDALNSDPLMVCCESGVLRFHKLPADQAPPPDPDDFNSWDEAEPRDRWAVELLPHNRDHLISKMMRSEWDPEATCPVFLAFLESIQPDPAIREFLQRWFGYCITGLTVEQKLAFFFGGGRNGKSTLVDTLARIMADYGTTIPIETLTGSEQRKGSDATPDLVRLPGARFVRASEPERGQRMKEALVKALTGGEAIMIRRMMQEFVEVTPIFKLTISGNHRPEIRGNDDGIWRRVLLVPFDRQIPADQIDRQLPRKLWEERAGIFAWMVEGAVKYLETGLPTPEAIKEATEQYRVDSDPIRTFLLTECDITGDPNDFERGRDIVNAFNAWRLWSGTDTFGKRTIANDLKSRCQTLRGPNGEQFSAHKKSDTGFRGIKISTDARLRIATYLHSDGSPRREALGDE